MSTQIRITSDLPTLRARWKQVKETYPSIRLSAHQALRAIDCENAAEEKATRVTASEDPSDAYTLCEALNGLARSLESWAYISARLWYECEQRTDEAITALYHCSITQYHRVMIRHVELQQHTYDFCAKHHILLQFGVITQSLDLSTLQQQGIQI